MRWPAYVPVLLLVLCSAGGARAQTKGETDSLRAAYRLPRPRAELAEPVAARAAVTGGAVSPRPSRGESLELFVGVAYTPRVRYRDTGYDGNAVIGVSGGDPSASIGFTVDLALYSTVRRGFGKRMGLDVEANRDLPGELILTLGWENIVQRGHSDIGSSRYVMLTRWFMTRPAGRPFDAVSISIGAGDGRFVSERDWLLERNRINPFASVTVRVVRPVMLIADWPGDDLTLAAAITPFRSLGLVVTPAVTDVTGRVSSGARFLISAGYSILVPSPFQ